MAPYGTVPGGPAGTVLYSTDSTGYCTVPYIPGHSRGTSLQYVGTLVYYTINKYITVQEEQRYG